MTLDERQQRMLDNGLARIYRGRLIPIIRGAEGDGDGGDGDGDKGGSGGGTGDRTFTPEQQQIVDKIVQERLARAKTAPPADYEDLKAKAAKLDEFEAKNKSELEKANERAAQLERERDDARLEAQETRLRNSIIAAAAGKLADPTDAVALLDRASIEYDGDGSPSNIDELITSLITAKPHLAGRGGGHADQGARSGGNGGGDMNQLLRRAAGHTL